MFVSVACDFFSSQLHISQWLAAAIMQGGAVIVQGVIVESRFVHYLHGTHALLLSGRKYNYNTHEDRKDRELIDRESKKSERYYMMCVFGGEGAIIRLMHTHAGFVKKNLIISSVFLNSHDEIWCFSLLS